MAAAAQDRRGTRRGGVGVPRLPAAGRVARRGRRRQAQVVRRPAVLGQAGSGLGRGAAAGDDPGPGARPRTAATAPAGCSPATAPATCCSRRCTAPDWPTRRSCRLRGWVGAQRHSGGRGGAVCATGQRADTGRTGDVRAVARRRVAADRCRRAGHRRAGAFAWRAALQMIRTGGGSVGRPAPQFGHGATATLHTTRRGDADRLLPPQPAEHVHRQAHPGDARRRLSAGDRRRGICLVTRYGSSTRRIVPSCVSASRRRSAAPNSS